VYTRGQVEGFGGNIKLVNDLGRNEQMEDEKNDVEDEVAVVEGQEEEDEVAVVEGQEEENVVLGLGGEEVIVVFCPHTFYSSNFSP